jgi:hypothetical protein
MASGAFIVHVFGVGCGRDGHLIQRHSCKDTALSNQTMDGSWRVARLTLYETWEPRDNTGMTPRKENDVASREQGRVVMLSGPVGAGKTTVARLLLPMLPGPWAYLEGDTFWSFIAKGENRSKRENFQVIMRSMTAAAVPFARSEFGVLLDFSIPPDFLRTAQKILKGLPLDFVVLRPTLEICARRAAERKEGKITNYGPYESFYALFERMTPATIDDVAGADAATLAIHIRDGLAADRFRVSASL